MLLLKVDQKENYVNVGSRLKQISLISKYEKGYIPKSIDAFKKSYLVIIAQFT